MFKDYCIVDDILDNPNALLDLSKKLNYYSSDLPEGQKPPGFWKGLRSDLLHTIDQNIFNTTFNEIFSKLFHNIHIKDLNFIVESYIHLTPEKYVIDNKTSYHKDIGSLFAGVVYLNKESPNNSGTTLLLENDSLLVENKFNRLVIYNSQVIHSPGVSFGSEDNPRTTLTFFVKSLNINSL